MTTVNFDYTAPKMLDEALALLQREDTQVTVSVRRIAEFRKIEQNEEGVTIGSGIRLADLAQHEATAHYTALVQALATIGDRHLLNHRTIGDALQKNSGECSAVAAALIALNASLGIVSKDQEKEVSISDFLQNNGLKRAELLAFVRLPPAVNIESAYEEANFLSGSKSVCGVAIGMGRSVENALRIVLAGCTDEPVRLPKVEGALAGKEIGISTIESALEKIKDESIVLRKDLPIGEDYLRHLISVLVKKAILKL